MVTYLKCKKHLKTNNTKLPDQRLQINIFHFIKKNPQGECMEEE